jgi:hypothetical protein
MRVAAIVLASAALLWTCGWAIVLLFVGFTQWVPDDSDGDTTVGAIAILLAVAIIPVLGAILGWEGARRFEVSRLLTWAGAGILALFFFSPGLLGLPYFVSAILMIAAATFRSFVGTSPSSRMA